ncbi:hypothetical protein OSB04_010084 [Centaurea solstitialis]|uniref:F-box domain-containing protein n=1 Tax=Centaurea solstitialis TaxID=347529 RepID=A0AA38WKA5_9ASTR|nr:hypothetical protein OSB04_010084 [Centaurea solstitialis]
MANRKKITLPELSPEIVLFHILSKLPAKSLLRFKCVCKQWRSFLTSPLFAKTHLHRVTTIDRRHHHEKVIFFHDKPPNFQTIDCEDGSLAKPRCFPFAGYALLVAFNSVNGLGIGINTRELCDIILWNPLTGEYKTLSRPIDTKCYTMPVMSFELYYTSCDDDYKILTETIDGNVYIYSLKSDSWRRLKSTLRECIPYAGAGDHNLLDGKLHFRGHGYTIIVLDLKTEKLTKIAVPPAYGHGEFMLMVVRLHAPNPLNPINPLTF